MSWSCEHCGQETADGPRTCDYCGRAMCWSCTVQHDDDEVCPNTAPVGTPTAKERDAQTARKANNAQELLEDLADPFTGEVP